MAGGSVYCMWYRFSSRQEASPYVGPRQESASPDANQTVPSAVTAIARRLMKPPCLGGVNTIGPPLPGMAGMNGLSGSQLFLQNCRLLVQPIAAAALRPPIQRR